MKKNRLIPLLVLPFIFASNCFAQISGVVYRDFNNNGTRENTSGTYVEPGVKGIIINAYNTNDALIASFKSDSTGSYSIPASASTYSGVQGSNTGSVGSSVQVRLEFIIPSTGSCLSSSSFDFSSGGGTNYGTSVRFVSGGTSNVNFAINNPADYVFDASPFNNTYVFIASQFVGNPFGGGTARNASTFFKFPFSRSGTSVPTGTEILANAKQTGSVYGVAYSKQANKIFTSAYLKRHAGFGPSKGSAKNAPGTIYMIDPTKDSSTNATTFLVSLDSLGFPTHNSTGTPAYGRGLSFRISVFDSINKANTLQEQDTLKFVSTAGQGVIGTNTQRGLNKDQYAASNDPAAFGQVGMVSLGDIEISDDGQFLFVTNLYDRKIYELRLNSATNPTAATYVNSWSLPNPPARSASGLVGASTTYASATADFYNGNKGYQRPFGLKFYRGKLYVGAVTTGENGGISNMDNNSGNCEYTDLWAYVWEFSTSAGFTSNPVLQFPLNYFKGINLEHIDESFHPWTNVTPSRYQYGGNTRETMYAQAMLSDLEFDVDGSMILAFRDRFGDQTAHNNRILRGDQRVETLQSGDMLRAYKNPTTCSFELEVNGKEGRNSPKAATSGKGNKEGFGDTTNTITITNVAGGAGDKAWTNINGARTEDNSNFATSAALDAAGRPTQKLQITNLGLKIPTSLGGASTITITGIQVRVVRKSSIANSIVDSEIKLLKTNTTPVGNNKATASAWPTTTGSATYGSSSDLWGTTWTPAEVNASTFGVSIIAKQSANSPIPSIDHVEIAVFYSVTATNTYSTSVNTTTNYVSYSNGANAGEFYYEDGLDKFNGSSAGTRWFYNTAEGSLAMLPGTERVLSTHVEPAEGGSTGVSLMSNNTGANTSDYSVKTDGTNISKGGGLGDIELLGQEPPIEIGNRVWNDANGDGIQNANESGIGNVDIWLYADFNNDGKPDGASGNLANLSALAGNTGTGVAWNTPSNVLTQNGTSTTASLSSGNPLSQTLQITNFGFSIPTSSTITGVTARIRRQADNASGVLDSTLKLVIGGLRTGNNKASGTAWTTSLSDFVYGGTTDLWGTNLTAAQVNATNFGLSLKVRNTSGANRIASVDVVEITVSYTNILGVTTTSTASGKVGEYYFNNSNVVDGDPNTSGNQTGLRPNKTYLMRIASFGTGSDWDTTANNNNGGANASGALAGFQLTTAHRLGSGALDLSDNDATIVNKVPQVSFTTSAFGVNIHTYDFGFDQMASIGDLVWRDDNKNGTQESGEPGVSGITVSLYQNGPDGNPGTSDDIPFGTVVTDAYGKYLFDNLPASSGTSSYYNVGFTLPANYQFTSSNTPGDNGNNTNSDANLYSGRTAGYNLSGGEYDATVDAGIIFNNPNQASVGDYVWYDINADGNQNTGEPGVSGVTVTLLNSAGTTVIATTITDANGYYLFTNVTPGTYRVGFSLPPGTAFTTNSGAVSGTTNSDATTTTGPNFGKTSTFTVNAGDAIRYVDAGIKSQPTSLNALGDFVWYDNNRDGIQDAGEPGIQGVKVRLLNSSGVAIDSTTTNAYGYYIFNNLTPGNYRVHFVKPSGLVITGQNQGSLGSADSDGNPTTGQTVLYTLIAGEKNMTVDCGLYGTSAANAVGALGDYVWNDLDRDGIQDSGEPGVAGITVILYNSSNVKLDTTSTNSSGYYLFPNLTPGNYYVEFLNIPLEFQLTSANQGGNDNTDSDADVFTGKTAQVSVTAGNTNSTLDAGLIQGAPAGLGSLGNRVWYDLPATAGGTNGNGIQDAGELGVANVTVELLDGNGNSIDPDGAGSLTKTTTITNALGEYMFTGLNAGNYMVEFSNLPANYTLTTQNAGSNDELDSDGGTLSAGKSRTGVYSLAQGEDNLTVDLGIKPAANTNSLGNFVWFDVDADGTQDANEKGVPGIMVQLYASNGDPVGCATDNIATDFTSVSDNDGTINFNGDWTVSGASTGIVSNTMRVYGNVGIATRNITMPAYGADNVSISLTLAHTGLSGSENFVIEYHNGTTWVNLGTYTSADIVGTKTFTSASVPGLLNITGIRFDEGNVGYANADFVSISNLNISLSENCSPITTTTNKDGEYLFTGLADGSYGVGFSNLPAGFNFTTQSATNDATGSDAGILSGLTTTVALGSSNRNDRSLDAGLVSTRAALGNYVWFDADKDGLQDNNEAGIAGVTVTLYDGTGNTVLATAITDQNGFYLFPNLTANTYVVGFTTAPYMDFTTANASTESLGTDSDADQVTGKTATVTLAASEINLNIDAGLYLGLPAQIGNYVWMDTNKNGVQENGENGVPGALIVLYNSSNVAISSAFTNGSGYYQITDVPAGSNYYLIFTANLPNFSTSATPGTNPAWTTQDVGTNATQSLSSGTESDTDSDITKSGANAGKTSAFTVVPGNNFPNMDAGIINGNQFSPVPVTWLTFRAFLVNKNEDVQLDWSTASEINNSHFEVQRSIDGKNFETIAFVNSKAINGQSNSNLNYTQLDPNVKLLNSDILYYRIKQVDYDGKFDFTQIEVIRLKDFATLRVYPNPTQDEVHISMNQISESESIEISVFDINGKLVLGKTIDNTFNNSLNTSLDIRQLENGIYTITIFDGINTNSLKIIKK